MHHTISSAWDLLKAKKKMSRRRSPNDIEEEEEEGLSSSLSFLEACTANRLFAPHLRHCFFCQETNFEENPFVKLYSERKCELQGIENTRRDDARDPKRIRLAIAAAQHAHKLLSLSLSLARSLCAFLPAV
jgi:hypothetical protein